MITPINAVVVEDDKQLLKLLVKGLAMYQINAFGVSTAQELWNILETEPIHVVVLDLGLPDEDGLSIALRLQESDQYGVIMASGRALDEQRILGLQCGADQYFVKPVNIEELAIAISNLGRKTIKLRSTTSREPLPRWTYNNKKSTITTPSGIDVLLTQAESIVVHKLLSSPGECVHRSDLLSALGLIDDPGFYSRLENIISRIRSKVAKHDQQNAITILPRRGKGYAFIDE